MSKHSMGLNPAQIRSVKGYAGYGLLTCSASSTTTNNNNNEERGNIDHQVDIQYTDTRLIGNGSFGVVYRAKLVQTGENVAIKKVLQDRRFKVRFLVALHHVLNLCLHSVFKNRELQIMKQLQHPNIVRLLYYFYSNGDKASDEYLNLILEYLPDTIYRVEKDYAKHKQQIPMFFVKLYMYQVFRALAYIHSKDICHRDVKPQNMLLNAETAHVKLCDFGSAKYLIRGESNVSYICSRYYRAPELIFGAANYSTSVDIWSTGCVFGEMLLGKAMFTGESGVDLLVEIIKVLGTPNGDQLAAMNPNFSTFQFPIVRSQPLHKVFGARVPRDATDLMSHLLEYTPNKRATSFSALAHPFFDELRSPNCRLLNGRDLPPLFDFSPHELSIEPLLNAKIIPNHLILRTSASSNNNNIDANVVPVVNSPTVNDGNQIL